MVIIYNLLEAMYILSMAMFLIFFCSNEVRKKMAKVEERLVLYFLTNSISMLHCIKTAIRWEILLERNILEILLVSFVFILGTYNSIMYFAPED